MAVNSCNSSIEGIGFLQITAGPATGPCSCWNRLSYGKASFAVAATNLVVASTVRKILGPQSWGGWFGSVSRRFLSSATPTFLSNVCWQVPSHQSCSLHRRCRTPRSCRQEVTNVGCTFYCFDRPRPILLWLHFQGFGPPLGLARQ